MSRPLSSSSWMLLALCVALSSGCPGGDPGGDGGADAGPAVDDAGTSEDAGAIDAGSDAGPAPDDAGPDGDEDAGDPDDDGGCALVDPCEGVAVTGGVRFEQTGVDTNAFGKDTATLTVGVATRSDVEALFGASASSDNPFRAWHCSDGIRVEYVDDVSGGSFEGNATAADIVARVVTLPGAMLSSAFGVTPGQTRAAAQAALSDPLSVDLEVGGFDASASDGLSVTSDAGGVVTAVALIKPQAAAHWDLPIDVAGAAIGTAPNDLARNDDLNVADTALGTGYDAQGIVTVDVGDLTIKLLMRIYAGYGIRVVARCPLFGSCDASNAGIQQIILSPPFVGQSSGGLGIGSVESQIVTAFGAGQPSSESEDLVGYTGTGGRPLGVAYVRDNACERRAAALLLNYTDPG